MSAYHNGYLHSVFDVDSLRRIAKFTADTMDKVGADIVMGRGVSGSMVLGAVGALYGKRYGIVRKPSEKSHSINKVEAVNPDLVWGPGHADWLIVDDLISSGSTIEAIVNAVEAEEVCYGKCKGIVLYGDSQRYSIGGTYSGIPIFQLEV